MKQCKHVLSVGMLLGLAVVLAGCGGGGGSSVAPSTSTVSGQVLTPGGSAPAQKVLGRAALASPGANVQVTLATFIVQNGAAVPQTTLGTKTTDANGNYSISFTGQLAPNQCVVVGSGASQMRAIVTGSTGVDIRPASEAAFRKFLTLVSQNSITLGNVRLDDVKQFVSKVLKAAGNAENGADISSAVAAAKTAADNDSEVETSGEVIKTDASTSSTIAMPQVAVADWALVAKGPSEDQLSTANITARDLNVRSNGTVVIADAKATFTAAITLVSSSDSTYNGTYKVTQSSSATDPAVGDQGTITIKIEDSGATLVVITNAGTANASAEKYVKNTPATITQFAASWMLTKEGPTENQLTTTNKAQTLVINSDGTFSITQGTAQWSGKLTITSSAFRTVSGTYQITQSNDANNPVGQTGSITLKLLNGGTTLHVIVADGANEFSKS